MDGSMIRPTFLAASVLAGACAVAACGGASAAAHPPSTASAAAAQSTAAARGTPEADPAPATRSTATPAPAPPPRPRVRITRARTADGALVTVATFIGPVRYVLHNGSGNPGSAASRLVRAGPAVSGAERRQLLAAFNGGFNDEGLGEVLARGQRPAFTGTELGILEILMRRSPGVADRRSIAQHVWDNEADAFGSNTIDVHLARLRSKLAGAGVQIETVRGVGYRIVAS